MIKLNLKEILSNIIKDLSNIIDDMKYDIISTSTSIEDLQILKGRIDKIIRKIEEND
jgi:hypothetical protein